MSQRFSEQSSASVTNISNAAVLHSLEVQLNGENRVRSSMVLTEHKNQHVFEIRFSKGSHNSKRPSNISKDS